jgi:hypothetical protein
MARDQGRSRLSRFSHLRFAIFSGIVFLVVAGWLFSAPPASIFGNLPRSQMLAVGLACIGLYLASHVLRAIRLAVIGVYIHKTSFRTIALLNLSVAPWSIIAPFKLDELVRLSELRTINGSIAKALMTIVIDRSMDGPMFVAFAAVLALGGMPEIALVAGLVGVAMIAVTLGFFAASGILHFAQSYVFLHHHKPRALHTLQIIDQLRQLASLGRSTIRSTAPILLACTLGIWIFEVSSVALMLSALDVTTVSLPDALSATLVRANSGWRALLLGEELGFPAVQITYLFFAGLLVIWPFTIWLYTKRRLLAVRNAEFLGRNWDVGFTRG